MWFFREKPPKRRKTKILVKSTLTGSFFYVDQHGATESGDILADYGGRDGFIFRLRPDGTGDYNHGDVTWEYVYVD